MYDKDPTQELSAAEIRLIRDKFHDLLGGGAKETDWQKFFSKHPFALSNSLPIKLKPADILPLGRPGKSEPDFLIYPGTDNSLNVYGVVELKSPATHLIRRARRNVVVLTASAQTAVGQLRRYNRDYDKFAPQRTMSTIRLKSHLFVVMGLSTDIQTFMGDIRENAQDILPSDVECLGYDELLFNFERGLPTPLMLEIRGGSREYKESSASLIDPRFDPDLLSRVIVLIYGQMDHDGPFWCYVAVKPSKFGEFKIAEAAGELDLYEFDVFGEVIVSAEGETPPSEVTMKVAEMYGADPETFFEPIDPIASINEEIDAMRLSQAPSCDPDLEPIDYIANVNKQIDAMRLGQATSSDPVGTDVPKALPPTE